MNKIYSYQVKMKILVIHQMTKMFQSKPIRLYQKQNNQKKQGKAVKNQTINGDIDHSKVKHLNDFPAEALSIVQTIKSIKAIVKYVKKVSNPIFQSHMCAFFYL